MKTSATLSKPAVRTLAVDAALIGAACLIPTITHLTALPLYMLNPMLALLLAGMLLGNDWKNGVALAVLMPVVACLVTGMPAAPKMVCMMAELATVATMFGWLSRRWAMLPAVLTAVVAGKAIYYVLKAIIIAPAVLIGTAWWIQLGAVIVWGGLFALLYKGRR